MPGHEQDGGHNPSVIIDFTPTGKALILCESRGCDTREILKAVGMDFRDLNNVADAGVLASRNSGAKEPVGEDVRREALVTTRLRAHALTTDQADHAEFLRRGFDPARYTADDLAFKGVGWDARRGEPTYTCFTPGGDVAYTQRRTDDVTRRWMSDRAPEGTAWDVVGYIGAKRHRDRDLIVCEGPADGLVASTTERYDVLAVRGSAMAKKAAPIIAQEAKGRAIVLAGDNDTAGRTFNETLADALVGVASSVKVVRWPSGTPPRFDLTDLRAEGPESFSESLDALLEPMVTGPVETPSHAEVTGPVSGGWLDVNLRNHQRIAARYAQFAEGRMIHVDGLGWHYWGGTRWVPDAGETEANKILTELLTVCWTEARWDRELEADTKSAMTANGSRGVLELAERRLKVLEVDADPWLLNCPNGTLDLRTLKLRPHDPADLITRVTPAEYDPAAVSEDWTYLLESSLPNPEVRSFLQRYLGMSLFGKVREHVLGVLKATGRNGKGVIVRSVKHALGDASRGGYTDASVNDVVLQGRYTDTGQRSAQQNDALMKLRGVRLAFLTELSDSTEMNEAQMKELTGGDDITAKFMHGSYQTFTPSHTFLMQSNELPRVQANSQAVWDRMRVIPFDVSFRANPDTGLEDRIAENPAAVLAWVVEGLREYWERGLDAPDEVLTATNQFRTENDVLRQFISSECVEGPDVWTTKQDFNTALETWARTEGEQAPTSRVVNAQMREMGFVEKQKGPSKHRSWVGVGLRAADEDS